MSLPPKIFDFRLLRRSKNDVRLTAKALLLAKVQGGS